MNTEYKVCIYVDIAYSVLVPGIVDVMAGGCTTCCFCCCLCFSTSLSRYLLLSSFSLSAIVAGTFAITRVDGGAVARVTIGLVSRLKLCFWLILCVLNKEDVVR
jgi:hypothetical protein